MTHQVTAPLVLAKNENGGDVYVYNGGFVDGQSEAWVERHLADGMIVDAATQVDEVPLDEKPAGNASEVEWREYALANGRTEEEMADLSRNDIRGLFE